MKIEIAGTEYPVDALGRLSLFDLLELKKQTGMNIDQMQAALTAGAENPDDQASSLLGSAEGLTALGALIWLTRRKAGESLTFEQACDFPLDEMSFIDEPGDEPETEPADPI